MKCMLLVEEFHRNMLPVRWRLQRVYVSCCHVCASGEYAICVVFMQVHTSRTSCNESKHIHAFRN